MIAIREAEDADSAQVIALIGGVFAEYPGCVLELDEMPELRAPASAFGARGGRFWVAEDEGRVVGCAGFKPGSGVRVRGSLEPGSSSVELCKLYVAAEARRRGLGSALCELVEAEGRGRGAAFVELWSDTRFADAHRLYEKRGYIRGPLTRELHDLSNSVEFYYRLALLTDCIA
jgi:putative acetyltransferase